MYRNRLSGYRSFSLWNFTAFLGSSRHTMRWCLNRCCYRCSAPVGHSQYTTRHCKSVKLKTYCLIAEHCLCWVIQMFKGWMVLKHEVLRSRRKEMSVFFRLNLNLNLNPFHLCLLVPPPVLSPVFPLQKSLSNSLYVLTVRPVGCGIRSFVWEKHNCCNYKIITVRGHSQLHVGSLTGQL
jgi:hypothetical protein